MNRREFLAATTAAAAAMTATTNTSGAAETQPATAKSPQPTLAPPPPGVDYFTEERLVKAIAPIDTSHIDFQTVCYTFNPWHPSPYMEKIFGKGWTEYETMNMARPQFPGHYQPKRPLWGNFNEADPTWAAREIDLASSAGIDVFMIDWYWHSGTMFYHEQLEQGFLKAPNRDKMKFAVMWANHHWPNLYPAPENGEEATLLPQEYSDQDMDRVGAYLVDHYFTQPNYWKLDNKPVFATFWTNHLIGHFGVTGLRKIFDSWQNRASKAGLAGIHFQASDAYDHNTPLTEAGYSSCTRYHTFAGIGKTNQTPFAQGAEHAIQRWHNEASKMKLPYFPECPVGWDNSPRYGKKAKIITHRTADQFERLLRAGKYFIAHQKTNPPVLFLGAWNEWTEDHYLLPDEVYGYSYLEAVKRQFKRT
ncbi:MAG TPA: glycoside hydrolase family 99-like domain-containing protein [Tepidisphaeraceae bacterium]|jgi:hypothetical protein